MCSCSIFFSLRLIFTSLAASISLFSHRRENIVMFLLQTKLVSFFYLSFYLFLCYPRQCRNDDESRKKDSALLLFNCPGGHAIYHLNAWVLEMQNFSTVYEGTEDFFRTKIYWMYNRTTANDHLSTTTTALRRPLFWLLRTKNHTWPLYKNSLQRQLSTVPKMAVVKRFNCKL